MAVPLSVVPICIPGTITDSWRTLVRPRLVSCDSEKAAAVPE